VLGGFSPLGVSGGGAGSCGVGVVFCGLCWFRLLGGGGGWGLLVFGGGVCGGVGEGRGFTIFGGGEGGFGGGVFRIWLFGVEGAVMRFILCGGG